ncbi:MAG: hypothetical protein ACP5NC_05835 [Nitrososphaeria archaeon]
MSRHKNTYKRQASTQECSNCHGLNKIPLSQNASSADWQSTGIKEFSKGSGYNLNVMDDEITTVMLNSARGIISELEVSSLSYA